MELKQQNQKHQLSWFVPFNVGKELEQAQVLNLSLEESIDYESMTVVQLRELAKERGLTGYSSLNKADLIRLLKDNE